MKIAATILFLLLIHGANAQTNTFPSSGNVGIGTTSPGAKLSFNNLNDGSNGADGITWYTPLPLAYGIFRSPGAWTPPDYQQLKLSWETGIVLDPGNAYGRSYVDIQRGGLRVSSGNVGIGTSTPDQKLDVRGNLVLEAGTSPVLYTGTGASELNRYLQLINTTNYGTASGLKAGGVLVSDTYAYANPGKNDLIVKGNLGIGIPNPTSVLDVNGAGRFRRQGSATAGFSVGGDSFTLQGWGTNNPYIQWVNSDNTRQGYMGWNTNRLSLVLENGYNFTVESGNVGIGTTTPGYYKLAVEGKIGAREVNVTTTAWSDHVFNADYKLRPLAEVQQYIEENHHLPEVPSEKEVLANGQNLGEMNAILLKKIEELTLYLIEQQNTNGKLVLKVQELARQLDEIKSKMR